MGLLGPSLSDVLGGFGGGAGAVNIPSAGDDLKSVLKVLSKESGRISKIERREVEASLDRLERFGPRATSLTGELQTQQVGQDIARFEEFSTSLREATADPLTQGIREALSTQVLEGLQAGSELTPGMQRQLQNAVRAAQTARGVAFGGGPVSEEAFAIGAQGEQLLRNRQNAALQFLGVQAQTQVDPLRAISGLAAGTPLSLTQPTGALTGTIPSLLGLQSSRTAAQFNATQAAQAAQSNQLSGLGQLAGGLLGFSLGGPVGAGLGASAGGILGGLF